MAVSISDDPGVNGIFDNAVDRSSWYVAPFSVCNPLFGKIPAKALRSIPFAEIFLKNQFHDLRFVRLDHKVAHILISLISASFMLQTITKWNTAAGKMTFLCQLLHSGLGADRGFDAFTGCLPVTDVIQQLVHMGIKPLLSFLGAPHLNAVFDKPLHNKRLKFFPFTPNTHAMRTM